jgi:hypothetical protein
MSGLPAGLMAERIEKSGEWERIADGEYLVENVTWNTGAATTPWSETIFCDPATGERGWRWDFSNETGEARLVVKSYPEIIWGRKPFEVYPATTPRMPAPLGEVGGLVLEYDYEARSENAAYVTATDICFTDSRDPGPANIRAKLMIWIDAAEFPFFPGRPTSTATIDGRECEVFINPDYEEPGQKWVLVGIRPRDLPHKGEILLGKYFDYLLAQGAIKSEWLLSSIETGTEIASGKGEVVFRKFLLR